MEREKNRIFLHIFKVFALAAMIFISGLFLSGRSAQAASISKLLTTKKTYKSYDITNDGKADKLRLVPGGASYGTYSRLKIKVNGKLAYTLNFDEYPVYSFGAQVITLSNNKSFLWVRGYAEDDDGQSFVLQYNKSSGKFKVIADINGLFGNYCNHIYSEVKSVKGKSFVLNIQMCSHSLGSINFDMTFTYKSGALNYAKKMTNCKVLYGNKKTNTLKTNKNIAAYATKALSGKKYTIKKNKTVKIKCFYLNGSKFEYKMDVNGKTRWKKFGTSYPSKQLFKNLFYYA